VGTTRRNRAGGDTGDMFGGSSFPFTEARVEAARRAVLEGAVEADRSGRRAWRDADCRGLSLIVNEKTGTSVYYFVGKANGQTTRRALGDTATVRLAEARQAIGRLRFDRSLTSVLVGRPADEEDAEPAPPLKATMEALLEAHAAGTWLPGRRSKRPSARTMKFYRDLRSAAMTDQKTDEDLELLTLEEFAARLPAIHAALAARAPIQANRALQLWRNLFAYATAAGAWRGPNPATASDGASRLTKAAEKPRQRVLTDAEWRRLDRAMMEETDPLWRHLFTFSIHTLQRMGAVCRCRWADLVLTGPEAAWSIPADDMKGRRSGHTIPLAGIPAALELLRARRKVVPKSCPWVFPGRDGEPVRNYDKAWDRIIRRAKLWHEDPDRRPRPHDLRRTGGSRMVSAGVPLNVVTRALGDAPSSVGMVARTYAIVADEALREAFAATAKRRPRARR
jgi:integrase